MKRFLTQYFLYSGLFLVLLGVTSILLNQQVSRSTQYQLPVQTHTVIFGHSHAECAYNDSLMKGVLNFAQSGESYFYSYVKIKELLKFNPHIKRIAIEVTNNMFEKSIDSWITEHKYIAHRYPKYSHFFDTDQIFFLFSRNPYSFIEAQNITFKTKLDYLRNKQLPAYRFFGWGRYSPLFKSKIDSLTPILEMELMQEKAGKVDVTNTVTLSTFNLAYLKKIVNFCDSNKIAIVFIRAPQHPKYSKPLPDSLFLGTIRSLYPKITFLDMGKFALTDDDFFDFEHVNNKGSQKVSPHLDSLFRLL